MVTMVAGAHYVRNKRNKLRRNTSAFQYLIASPFDLGSIGSGDLPNPLPMPERGARLAVSHSTGVPVVGDVVVSGQSAPVLGNDIIHRFPDVEIPDSDVTVNVTANLPAGTVTIYVLDEQLRSFPIATGTIT